MITEFDIMERRSKLKRPFILDGAIGSNLTDYITNLDDKLWGTITDPKYLPVLEKLYLEYAEAGADILTTNTFRTNPFAMRDYTYDSKTLVNLNSDLTVKLAHANNRLAAGANPPAEDCYSTKRTITKKELERNHKYHIDYLLETGVDFILNETQSHLDEIEIVSEYCSNNTVNYLISLYFGPNGRILSGETIFEAVEFCLRFDPTAVLINCIDKITFNEYWDKLRDFGVKGYYLNCFTKARETDVENIPDEKSYGESVYNHYDNDIFLIGSCCGSNYKYTDEIRRVIDELNQS